MQAMKLAENTSASAKYSYGWQRAEVLGALINAVFLLALCFSIGLEAVARFLSGAGELPVYPPCAVLSNGSLALPFRGLT